MLSTVGRRPNDMALGPDGRLFVACSGDNTVHVIQTRSVEEREPETTQASPPAERVREILSTSLYPSSPEGSTPCGVAVAPDGDIVTAGADGKVYLVSAAGALSAEVEAGQTPIIAVAISGDGRRIAAAGIRGSVAIIDRASGREDAEVRT